MTKKTRLGMLTPSSNSVVEPMTAAMLSGVPDISCAFQPLQGDRDRSLGRFRPAVQWRTGS